MTTLTFPRTPTTPSYRYPSTTRYWIGGALIALGIIGSLAWAGFGWLALMHHVDGFPRVAVPGTVTLHVNADSKRVLYAEHARGVADVSATDIQVVGPSGQAVPVGAYSHVLRYDVPGDATQIGRAVATFRSTVAGTYTVTVSAPASGTVAIGDDVVWSAVPHVIGAVAVFLVFVGAGTTLIGVTAVQRSRIRRI